ATPAIQNKVGQFVSNPLIRNIIGQPKSAFDIRKAMDEKKIIIINLSKGRVGEDNSRLIGAMLVTKLYLAAMSRVDTPEPERADFFLYVDEFQNFASESFANILSEARKYRLSLILTHQYVAQMDEKVRDAVFGNVGTTVTFRVGAEDAEMLEKEFSPEFTTQDIVNLGFANIYLKLMIDGVASHPFSATTLPPMQKQAESFKEQIIEASRKNYGGAKEAVEEKVNKWMEEISGGDIATGLAKKWPAREPAASPKPQGPLYDAVCAACGKRTQVPFAPDPNRPVFCKEHIGLAGQYKQQTKPRSGEFMSRQPERTASLKELEKQPPSRPRMEPASTWRQGGQPFKKPENLQALREALKKSLSRREVGTPTSDLKNLNSASGEAQKTKPEPEPAPKSNAGTLNPGEKLEL
ncbi:MAG: TraM recognition domain-containing protein, partial [bacterium]|nr:TraM recognition domain-containing protein [bacterium]